ncbi:D-alanyl-D-alanine carboxypeptidase family protein [Cellulomonas shaoxiangyii]|uniref:Peptidase M15 n=1 Tax=Cellulomonas shaoxiangyii TaxID=2566013 RepID=A0A4P7SND8_9CELL|nr:D-alanyl-D-alanine carboxypeptidase family protein [Cellulomonas shaoxiangyii]QCB94786.1 peptidase M15 [Cellulomonas shaoxiangyii]TGY86516.1 peptidase M15 [Cellulomonas shaoxiangyii]
MTTTTDPRPPRSTRRPHRSPLLGVLALLLAGGAGLAYGLTDGPGPPAGVVVPPGAPTGATGLHPDLERRLAAAREAAAADGVTLTLTSGLRTAAEQQELVDEAVDEYGAPEAYRWVLPPERSAHVQGLAIDVGPTAGAYWLQEHGPDLGLCPTYVNEVWHFELLAEGAAACPEPRADSSWAW